MNIVQFEELLFERLSFKLKQILNLVFDLKEADVLILTFLDSEILIGSDLESLYQEMRNIQDSHFTFHEIIIWIEKIKACYGKDENRYQILQKIGIILWIFVDDNDIFEYCEKEKIRFKEAERMKNNKLKLWREK